MNKKLTVVQCLIETMLNSQGMEQPQIDEVFQQALQMEREQIEEAYRQGQYDGICTIRDTDASDYFTHNFKP